MARTQSTCRSRWASFRSCRPCARLRPTPSSWRTAPRAGTRSRMEPAAKRCTWPATWPEALRLRSMSKSPPIDCQPGAQENRPKMLLARHRQLYAFLGAIAIIGASAAGSQYIWREAGLKSLQAVNEQRVQLVANALTAEVGRQDHLP